MPSTDAPIFNPFTILVDSREQKPYTFKGLTADARHRHRPMVVETEWFALKQGDYSIKGYEDKITVERKSLADLYGTVGQGHDRFRREHERMAELDRAFVIIEGTWEDILNKPPYHTKLNPKAVFRTATKWATVYNVHWIAVGRYGDMTPRRVAEITTFRILQAYWEMKQ